MKKQSSNGFLPHLVREWDEEDGVNFAIALTRMTRWILYVAFVTDISGKKIVLRMFVGNHLREVYDFSGHIDYSSFLQTKLFPIAQERTNSIYAISTCYYHESELEQVPLRTMPNEQKIRLAQEAILKNTLFLAPIKIRDERNIPAFFCARYSFDYCSIFADAKRDLHQLPAFAIDVKKYEEKYFEPTLGYCYSINMHPDGQYEDVWGKQPLEIILKRFGILEYELSESMHISVSAKLKKSDTIKYNHFYEESVFLISSVN